MAMRNLCSCPCGITRAGRVGKRGHRNHFKMQIVSFMRKHSRELNFMTFAAEIRLQITDLPLKLVIWPIGFLVSIHRTPPRNPSTAPRLMPRATLHAVSADLIHYLDFRPSPSGFFTFCAKLLGATRSASTVIQPLTVDEIHNHLLKKTGPITGCLQQSWSYLKLRLGSIKTLLVNVPVFDGK